MAAGSKLVLDFETSGSANGVRFSYNYADPDAAAAKVKALVNGLIANGSIFEFPPITAKNAKIVTTSETDYDLSEE